MTSYIGRTSGSPVVGFSHTTERVMPACRRIFLIATLYFCREIRGRIASPGRSLYLSRISRASFSKCTRTTTGRPSLVFLGMYSTAPLMILRLVMAYRSLIRHPTRLWNTKTSLYFSNAGSKLKSVLYTCFLSSIVMKIGVPYTHSLTLKRLNGLFLVNSWSTAQRNNVRSLVKTSLMVFCPLGFGVRVSGYDKTSKMVTFGHRNAKGDRKTPQNLLFLFFVGDSNVVFFSRIA